MPEKRVLLLEEPVTRETIGAMFTVHNKMGYGFLEGPYVGAMEQECKARGLHVEREQVMVCRCSTIYDVLSSRSDYSCTFAARRHFVASYSAMS